jgi:hypothetical protein
MNALPITVKRMRELFPAATVDDGDLSCNSSCLININVGSPPHRLKGSFTAEELVALAIYATPNDYAPFIEVMDAAAAELIIGREDDLPSFTEGTVRATLNLSGLDEHMLVGTCPNLQIRRDTLEAMTVDGHFYENQLQALAFWILHPEEFSLRIE